MRVHNWRCWGCRGWRNRKPVAQCPHCLREMPIGDYGTCRLCWQQALHHNDGDGLDFSAANRYGQQLFLANTHYRPRGSKPAPKPRPSRTITAQDEFVPVAEHQMALFPALPRLMSLRDLAPLPESDLAHHLDATLQGHAREHGWSPRLRNVVAGSLRALQQWQDTPGAVISARTAQELLSQAGVTTVTSTLEVLDAAGLLNDDRVPSVRRFFLDRIDGLPEPMHEQLDTWYSVMIDGSQRAPRRHPRSHRTIRLNIRGMAPLLHGWAAAGHTSLATITRDDVRADLPNEPVARLHAFAGLRSLFTVLKGRRALFTNPTTRINARPELGNQPLPVDTATLRAALNDPDPARAFAVAMVAFHGISAQELRQIKLTDIVDGYLRLPDRGIPLAEPVRARLRAYLDHRVERWPITANPHLLINRRTAPRTTPVDARHPWHKLQVNARAVREDRILHEVFATAGDLRRICELFGLSVTAAARYTSVLDHPDLAETNS
ncbi:hypothetical protein [Pseudonocardia sp. EC080625-04]|uniref:hypothetical protein n=1 Tax=Pseudonocardia sp. EC080625-04 TaxID=1096868 RepID=UPI001EE70D10|nr:hypothetical protein [Pseudonocardia sp. EC080625-04]